MQTILVTGATGTIGTNLVAELLKLGDVKVRVAARDRAKVPAGAEHVDFAWEDPAKIAAAVQGVDAAFLLTPFVENFVPLVKTFVDACKAAGVKKIVKLSAAGAENPGFPLLQWHADSEKLIEASGVRWVHLRPNFFMTNLISYYPPDAEGAMYLPTGDGKGAWIDPADIADVAARVLTRPDWDGRALDLTGPEALSIADVAKQISDVTGRNIRHVDVPEAAARSAMVGMQLPAWMIDGMLALHNVIKQNWAAAVSPAVKEITGHEPRSFASFAKQNAAAWKK
jgi:uncharacterized protein YbjT (DUF2867 family)